MNAITKPDTYTFFCSSSITFCRNILPIPILLTKMKYVTSMKLHYQDNIQVKQIYNSSLSVIKDFDSNNRKQIRKP